MRVFTIENWSLKRVVMPFVPLLKLNFILPSEIKLPLRPLCISEKYLEYETIIKSISYDKYNILHLSDEESTFKLLDCNRVRLITERLTHKDINEIINRLK